MNLEKNSLQEKLLALAVIVFVALSTFQFVEGAGAQKKNRWEGAIRAFEKKDRESPPPKGAILFVGSSSIRIWKLKKYFPNLKTINRGFGGSCVSDSVEFCSRIVTPYKPRTIVFYAGDNDIAAGKTPETVLKDFNSFVLKVRKKLPKTRIIYIPIKPSISRWKLFDKMSRANSLIEKKTKKDKLLFYVDIVKPMIGRDGKPRKELFRKDGLHLNDKGYKLWSPLVLKYIKKAEAVKMKKAG